MSPLGASGGRSAANRQGQGALRRNTPREKARVEPPQDQLELAFPPKATRVQQLAEVFLSRTRFIPWQRVASVGAWGVWAAFCAVLAVIVCRWWGLL